MDKRAQEARGMKRGAVLTALLIGTFIAFLNENLLTNVFPGLMREFIVAASACFRAILCGKAHQIILFPHK
ncbi:hypothetical protein [Paenibacillus mesophilus]|uniref:hypothetical protein n=1 Tax=Paenibacillus mesophilus TaxID=2582849 RepID=UPI001EE46DB2|nr:hypothetical protein [Paenibacillus mesophilus]